MGWKSTEATLFRFENKGDELIGQITNTKETKFGKAYDIINGDGGKLFFFGGADLNRKLENALGKIVKIVFQGEKQLNAGKTMKSFSVEFWKSEDNSLPEGFKNLEADVPF